MAYQKISFFQPLDSYSCFVFNFRRKRKKFYEVSVSAGLLASYVRGYVHQMLEYVYAIGGIKWNAVEKLDLKTDGHP